MLRSTKAKFYALGVPIVAAGVVLSNVPSVVAKSSPVTITMWTWPGAFPKAIQKQFNATHHDIKLSVQVMSFANVNTKLQTALAAGSGAPDVVSVPIDTLAQDMQYESAFDNLYDLGAKAVQHEYLPWKFNLALDSTHHDLLGLPIDVGPTVLYYNATLFKKAGLPSSPAAVTHKFKTWDELFKAAKNFKKATGESLFGSIGDVFNGALTQGAGLFYDKNGQFIGDKSQVKVAFDLAVKAYQMGLVGNYLNQDYWIAASKGKFGAIPSASWEKGQIELNAPNANGVWRVAQSPGGVGNLGGSWLSIPKQSTHPKQAMEVLEWLVSPKMSLENFENTGDFPSTPSEYSNSYFKQPDPFFGGERVSEQFAVAAKSIKKEAYHSPYYDLGDTIFPKYLEKVVQNHMPPSQAWNDAVNELKNQVARQ